MLKVTTKWESVVYMPGIIFMQQKQQKDISEGENKIHKQNQLFIATQGK